MAVVVMVMAWDVIVVIPMALVSWRIIVVVTMVSVMIAASITVLLKLIARVAVGSVAIVPIPVVASVVSTASVRAATDTKPKPDIRRRLRLLHSPR